MKKKEQKQRELTLEEKVNYLTKLNSNKYLRQVRNEKGITLIALVVTIVILLILAGVTLGTVLSDGGLIDKSKEAIGEHEKAQDREQEELGKVVGMMGNLIDKLGNTEDNIPLVTTVTDTNHDDNKEVQDSLGNLLVIPSGFKHKEGTKVEEGIVIEDKDGNEFVWIPVSNIDGNNDGRGTGLIKTEEKGEVEITLGRYTFKDKYDGTQSLPDGTPELVQKGSESANDVTLTTKLHYDTSINWNIKESTNLKRTNGGEGAKDLAGFIKSVKDNHGYYLARYEAGAGTGGKPVSKVGAVWNNIAQPAASAAARKMYEEEVNYTSDLVNSYAWDTAIVYIQAMGNDNYANAKSPNSDLMNTGTTKDEKCHIFDMAGNVSEHTTEYSTLTGSTVYPCVLRGGFYDDNGGYGGAYTGIRGYHRIDESSEHDGFRPILYLK